MKVVRWGTPSRSSDTGCRHLAVRVIEQAFRDLSDGAGSPADQESARTFLAGSRTLYQWCEIAEVNASCTIERARALDGASRSNANRPEEGGHHVEQHHSSLARGRRLVGSAGGADGD
jgi:hypothetical protein